MVKYMITGRKEVEYEQKRSELWVKTATKKIKTPTYIFKTPTNFPKILKVWSVTLRNLQTRLRIDFPFVYWESHALA